MITLLYDVELRRPACVLLQAMARGDKSALYRFFDTKTWLVSPTPGMRRITATAEQWERVATQERGL